jgi:S1-C subfamily serine protease
MPFASGVLAALLALLIYNLAVSNPTQLTATDVKNTVAEVLASATPPPAYSAQVYRIIQPSLVLIEAETLAGDGQREDSLGSGVIVTLEGDILTSLHVVADASEITVTFYDGTRSPAQIVSAQPEKDIAVLYAEELPRELVPAVLGNPGAMRVGDEAFAVGNPFGLYSSMSAGVISGFNRSFQPENSPQRIDGLIQIDAAVNPGNSGGPLLNRDGFVIGIVTGIINPTNENFFVGIGFAVPIDTALGGLGSPPY